MPKTMRQDPQRDPNTPPNQPPDQPPHPGQESQPQKPWEVPGIDPESLLPCDCCKPKIPPRDPCRKPPRSRDKNNDCCDQILEILRRMPGGQDIKLKKPKQSVKVKVANLCCKLPVKDSVIPMLLLFLRRWLNGTPPVNSFEKRVQTYLSGLPAKKVNALKLGLDAYEKIPPPIRECAFETRFDGKVSDEMLDPQFLFKVWLDEAVSIGRTLLYDKKDGQLGAGKVRPWDWIPKKDPDSKVDAVERGPWPWICAVKCGAKSQDWYRNMDVLLPGKNSVSEFKAGEHEFLKVCKPIDPKSPKTDCDYARPSSSGLGTNCHNNLRYNYPHPTGTACLVIPKTFPGQEVTVRGLNFCSPRCKALLRYKDGVFQDLILDCGVMGDDETPEMRDGKVVASCEVRDIATFTIPKTVKSGLNDVPIPPGRYTLELIVPNDSNYAPAPGPAPKEFISRNDVWLDILPDPDQAYRYWTDAAICINETDGPGSDEPWFQAFTVMFNPGEANHADRLKQGQMTILKTGDVDSGEWIPFSAGDVFNGKFQISGQYSGAFAMSVIGLEVDSESAAKEQIDNFGAAFADFMGEFFAGLWGVGANVIESLLKYGLLTAGLLVVAIATIIATVIGLFYAAWAPADPIGLDYVALDAVSLFDLTNPQTPLPDSIAKQIDEYNALLVNGVDKKPKLSGTSAIYTEERTLINDEEYSVYRFYYHAERL